LFGFCGHGNESSVSIKRSQFFSFHSLRNCSAINVSLSPRHCASLGCGWRNGLRYGGLPLIYRISSSRTADKWWSSSLWWWGGWLGDVLRIPYRKNVSHYELLAQKASNLFSGTCECGDEHSGFHKMRGIS
jgi:hypothetical protein